MKVIVILCLAAGAAGLAQSRFDKRRGASRPLCLLDSGFSFSEVREVDAPFQSLATCLLRLFCDIIRIVMTSTSSLCGRAVFLMSAVPGASDCGNASPQGIPAIRFNTGRSRVTPPPFTQSPGGASLPGVWRAFLKILNRAYRCFQGASPAV